MKKHIINKLLITILAMILMTSCGSKGEQETTLTQTNPPTVTEDLETSELAGASEAEEFVLPDNFPELLSELWVRIDGSTATIPLTTALHSHFEGTGKPPRHNTTEDAYNNLFGNRADLIFVTCPSENELAEAKEEGIELEVIPIVKDALVFLVNHENPVDGISKEQLRDIYSGKITNWSTLGGLDETIVPYQRTPNSGSQTLLLKLVMGELEPMDPPGEWLAASMGSLVEVVSNYDNSRDAIGYSVFYYVNNMYGNSSFKLLDVDGVTPSRDTISGGEYPLEDYYYAVIRKDTPDDSTARMLIDWLLTEEGQIIATQAGYIPLQPLENVFSDETIDPIYLGDVDESSGTGGTELKSADAIEEIVFNGVRIPLSDIFYDDFNYIRYINSEIMNEISSPYSAYRYSESLYSLRLDENIKRPFTGIPNDYPNYELVAGYSSAYAYIKIDLPYNNPFFRDPMTFNVPLTSDISPYGTETVDYSVSYDYDRRLGDNIDLFTLNVKLPKAPEVAQRINEQLKTWTDGFPGDEDKTKLLDSFVRWYYDDNNYGDFGNVYRLQPESGIWNNYLSVSYTLQTYDGPSTFMPTPYTICFDMNTGEIVNLAELLPKDLPYAAGLVFSPITNFDDEDLYPSREFYENYTPVKGSVIISAWGGSGYFGLYVTEPDGRELQVGIYYTQ